MNSYEDPALSYEIDREADLYVAQYLKFLDEYEIDIEQHVYASEMTVYNEHDGWAGTLDLMPMLRLDGYIAGHPVAVLPDEKRHVWMLDNPVTCRALRLNISNLTGTGINQIEILSEASENADGMDDAQ